MMTTAISGIISILAGMVCIFSLMMPDNRPVKVGDVFAHNNPGNSGDDPNEKPDPFVSIKVIEEVVGNKARYKVTYSHANGRSFSSEGWDSVYSLQKEIRLN